MQTRQVYHVQVVLRMLRHASNPAVGMRAPVTLLRTACSMRSGRASLNSSNWDVTGSGAFSVCGTSLWYPDGACTAIEPTIAYQGIHAKSIVGLPQMHAP